LKLRLSKILSVFAPLRETFRFLISVAIYLLRDLCTAFRTESFVFFVYFVDISTKGPKHTKRINAERLSHKDHKEHKDKEHQLSLVQRPTSL